MIPALPEVLNRSLSLLEISMESNKLNTRLHDAVFTLFSSLFVHLPYMVSASHLDRLLVLAFKSAATEDLDNDNRQEALRFMARKVDMGSTFASIDRNWEQAVKAGPAATREVLEAVSLSIEKHPKSATMKNLSVLTSILFRVFDLRREQVSLSTKSVFDTSDLEEVEDLVNDVTIKMIYKLNDTMFRPIFSKLVEWATALPKKDTQGSLARLTTFYRFLQVFFSTLQVRFPQILLNPYSRSKTLTSSLVYRHRLRQLHNRKRRLRPLNRQPIKPQHEIALARNHAHAPKRL